MVLGCSNCSYQPWQSGLAPVPRCPGRQQRFAWQVVGRSKLVYGVMTALNTIWRLTVLLCCCTCDTVCAKQITV